MQVNCYLVVQGVQTNNWSGYRKPGQLRLTKKKPATNADEIAISLSLDIPDALFSKPTLEANITIPEGAPLRPVMAAEVGEEIAQELERRTGFAVTVSLPDGFERLRSAECDADTDSTEDTSNT